MELCLTGLPDELLLRIAHGAGTRELLGACRRTNHLLRRTVTRCAFEFTLTRRRAGRLDTTRFPGLRHFFTHCHPDLVCCVLGARGCAQLLPGHTCVTLDHGDAAGYARGDVRHVDGVLDLVFFVASPDEHRMAARWLPFFRGLCSVHFEGGPDSSGLGGETLRNPTATRLELRDTSYGRLELPALTDLTFKTSGPNRIHRVSLRGLQNLAVHAGSFQHTAGEMFAGVFRAPPDLPYLWLSSREPSLLTLHPAPGLRELALQKVTLVNDIRATCPALRSLVLRDACLQGHGPSTLQQYLVQFPELREVWMFIHGPEAREWRWWLSLNDVTSSRHTDPDYLGMHIQVRE